MSGYRLVATTGCPPSLARVDGTSGRRTPLRLGLVQQRWHPDPYVHEEALMAGIALATREGASLVCLQELTLSPYFATTPDGPHAAGAMPESLRDGRTVNFARRAAALHGVHVHASLYEAADGADGPDGLGYNTAVVVAPDGRVVSRTRKLHIPVTAGYREDHYFRPGPAAPRGDAADGDTPFPVLRLRDARLGFPTCWDQWFPELARAYALAGADVIVYPTAIGSEPDHPNFDTRPLWEQVIVANGIANGTFMVAVNRIGDESPLCFYGSSFISDPYGRVLVRAPRDEPAVLVADLDLYQRDDWLDLFPFLQTRRPDAYGSLTAEPELQGSAAVRSTLVEFFRRFNAGDGEGAASLIAADEPAFVIGTQRVGTGRAEWVRSLTAYAAAGASFELGDVRAWSVGDMGWAVDEPTMVLPDGLRLKLRMTAVLERTGTSGHRIVHQHFSFAVPDDVSDEHAAAWRTQLGS